MRIAAALRCLSLLVLGACGANPSHAQAARAPAETGAPQASNLITAMPCPVAPSPNSVREAIKSALIQIDGGVKAAAPVVVTTMTATDCHTLVVSYKASGARAKATLSYADDDAWYVTLFAKRYPVK